MEKIEILLQTINDFLWSEYILIPLLLGTGIWFTLKFKFLQFRMIPEMFRILFHSEVNNKDEKVISSIQAFAIGLASRVGTGNLAGVAIAISIGGPSSIFWMWVVALLGSISAFVESTLAQMYKVEDEETTFRGGPAYYMRDGLKSKTMGFCFAVLISICFGLIFNAVQANTISSSLAHTFNIQAEQLTNFNIIIGIVLAALVGYIIFGGAKKIAKVSTVIVPVMALLYIGLALLVIILNFNQIDDVFGLIMKDAFTLRAATGGLAGGLLLGIKRGLFSNEAGMGSAPNAAATASVKHPVTQGLIQALGVFVDTIIICSATSFIILCSGYDYASAGSNGIQITQNALASVLGNWTIGFLAIAIFFFAFSSVLGNYFYSQSNIEFINDKPLAIKLFKVLVMIMVFFGAVASSNIVWTLADIFMALMAILNIIAILLLSKYVTVAINDYLLQRKTTKDPIFDSKKYELTKHLTIWNKKD